MNKQYSVIRYMDTLYSVIRHMDTQYSVIRHMDTVGSYLQFLLLLLNKLSFSDTTVIEGGRERKHS